MKTNFNDKHGHKDSLVNLYLIRYNLGQSIQE